MSITARCPACRSVAEVATSADGQQCPQCGAILSADMEVYDAEIIPLDEASIVTPEADDALLIKDDDLVDEIAESPAASPDTSDPMAFLKSLEPPPVAGRRRCPKCREYILPTAVRCRHCHLEIDPTDDSAPLATPQLRDLGLAERQLMKSYRGGMKLIIGYAVSMILVALCYAAAYGVVIEDSQFNDDASGLSLLFAMCWAFCACFCCANSVNAIRFVGLLCALDLIWMVMDLNPIGLITSGIMLWVVVGTLSKARALRQRGITLNLKD